MPSSVEPRGLACTQVDLAGSERVHVTGATGKRLEESKKINQSLSGCRCWLEVVGRGATMHYRKHTRAGG